MSWRCRFVSAAFIVVLATAVAPPAMGIGQSPRDGFQFGPTSVAVAFDSGLTVNSTSPFGDQLVDITPTSVTYTKSLRRSNLSFTYTPRIEIYGAGSVFNSLDHVVRASYRVPLSRSLDLDTRFGYLRTNDRARQTGNLTLAPRGRYVRANATVGLSYDVNPDTTLRFSLDAALSQFGLTPISNAAESIEQLSNVARVNFSRTLGRSQTVSANYGFLRTSSRDPRVPGTRTNDSDSAYFGYNFRSRSGLALGTTVGIVHRRVNDTYSHSFSFNASKQWQELTFSGQYARTIAGLLVVDPNQIQDPTLINRTVQNANLRISGEFARRVRLTQTLRWTRAPRSGIDEPFQSVAGNTYVAVRAGNTVAPYVNVTYWLQNTAVSTTTTASRFRLSAGLQFHWNKLVGAP